MDRSKSKQRIAYNTFWGIIDKFVICLLGMVVRRVFLQHLGAELSGLSSLFQNIIEFLNLATAGLAAAILPRLYQYNSTDDWKGISGAMRLLKQFYTIVAVVILVLGIGLSFFLEYTIHDNVYSATFLQVVFLIQVLSQCTRMLSSADVSLLGAREQGYMMSIADMVINIAVYLLQIYVILHFANYIGYLLLMLMGYIVYALVASICVKRLYPNIRYSIWGKLERIPGLFSDIKFTVFMQIANFIFCSTDSIVLSGAVGLKQVNAYSNYMTVATAVIMFYTAMESAIKNYYGNKLVIHNEKNDCMKFLNIVTFVFFVAGCLLTFSYVNAINTFVSWWLGSEYVLNRDVTFMFGLYLYAQMIFTGSQEYLQIKGVFREDMRANVSSAICNLVISICLVRYWGILGVLFGTVCGFILRFILRTKAAYRHIGERAGGFFLKVGAYIAFFVAGVILNEWLITKILFENVWMKIIFEIGIAGITTLLLVVIFCRTKEMREILTMLRIKERITGRSND